MIGGIVEGGDPLVTWIQIENITRGLFLTRKSHQRRASRWRCQNFERAHADIGRAVAVLPKELYIPGSDKIRKQELLRAAIERVRECS